MTPKRVWRRAREVVREQGLAALVFMALGDLGYRRLLVLERWLDEPISVVTPRAALSFSMLEPAQIEEYLRFHDEAPRARLEERFAHGDECFLARHEGRIVCVSWAARGEHFIPFLRYRYPIRPTEAYLYDSFTDPAFRGRSIAPALGVHVLERLRSAGVTRLTMAVAPENLANRRARAKTGFTRCGRIDCLLLGDRAWHSHREKRERRRP